MDLNTIASVATAVTVITGLVFGLLPYVEEERRIRNGSYAEWFQWLTDRLNEYPVPGKADGAHVAHRDWVP